MRTMKNFICKALVLLTLTFFLSIEVSAQAPGTPGRHSSGSNESSGGSAPIGEGLLVLIALGAGWAGYKANAAWKKQE